MEKVQFQLESTLPELKDLYDKGLFSKHEIDQITKRRTQFETSLIRLKTRKEDFFKYAEYEINLERLRKVRWKKCGYHTNPPGPSASTYSLPRRTLYILKRCTAKFPGDLAVWLAYVEYAAHQGMTKVVGKGLNSALQHHPVSPTLYLLLAHHHLHPGEPLPRSAIPSSSALDLPTQRREESSSASFSLEGTGPARTTLLLGLRVMPKSHTLWKEYVKLELGWVEGLRRRWRVLGLTTEKKGEDFDGDVDALVGGDGAFGPEGEDARRAILAGQLVVHALESALSKVPVGDAGRDAGASVPATASDGMGFREELLSMLRAYPSPLRSKAQAVVYADLEKVAAKGGRDGARARLALLTRPLYDQKYEAGRIDTPGAIVLEGVELVQALGAAGKEIRSVAKKAGPEWSDVAGAWIADRIVESKGNADLQRYLLSTLKALTKASLGAPASILLRHLELVKTLDPESYLATARSHASQQPLDPELALVRVEAETAAADNIEAVRSTCSSVALSLPRGGLSPEDQAAVVAVWLVWAAFEDAHAADTAKAWKVLLASSLRATGVPDLHPRLLAAYFEAEISRGASASTTLDTIVRSYHPTPAFFEPAFKSLADAGDYDDEEELPRGKKGKTAVKEDAPAHLYRCWRGACRTDADRVAAALIYARHLLELGRGRDAHVAVETARRDIKDPNHSGELDEGWTRLVDAAERARMASDESEDEEMSQDESGEEREDEEMASDGEDEGSDDEEGSDGSGDLEMTL